MRVPPLPSLILATLLGIGCTAGKGDTGDESGGGDDSGGDDTAAISCTPFDNISADVASTGSADAPPAMTGGTIVSGTYVLAQDLYYNGESNSGTLAETLVLDDGLVKNMVSPNGGEDVLYAGSYSASGSTLTFTLACPSEMTVTVQYTATATTLSYTAPDDANHVLVFTKQ